MTSFLHGLHEQLTALTVVLDVGRESTLVADVARVGAVLVLDHGLEGVVALNNERT